MAPGPENGPGATSGGAGSDGTLPLQVAIPNTEERSSMLKSFTVYIVEINDFGRKYQIERRFDDFAKLHADLLEVDPNMPPLPEKRMFASTDASVVAERKPAFERILRHLLRSEEVVLEKHQTLFKFLELPAPAVVSFRYLFKGQRLNYARQSGKLTDPKYEKEHAYRLSHPAMVRTSLRLLASEGALQDALKAAQASKEPSVGEEGSGGYASLGGAEESNSPDKGSFGESTPPAPKRNDAAVIQEAEAAIVEMLRFGVANGSEQVRKFFLQEKGIAVVLSYIFRKGRSQVTADAQAAGPDQRARNVLNALIKAEGDKFPSVFAAFLETGGVSALSSGIDLLQQNQGFADFVSKLLWIAWDQEAQRAFLAEAHSREALGLLGALFQCPSKGARVCAGLLLACALANQLLEGREAQAAAGVSTLTEEMVASAPCWPENGKETAEDAELSQFVQGLGQSDERFSRILTCAQAPWQLHGGNLPGEDSPLWPGASFALWCLLKMRPKPPRLALLRPALPAVAQNAPMRVRWLAGEILLMLQLQVPSDLSSVESDQPIVEMTFQERAAMEAALLEQFEHGRRSLNSELHQSSKVIADQQGLAEERQRPLPLASSLQDAAKAAGQAGWQQPLEVALSRLAAARKELSSTLVAAHTKRDAAEQSVREVLDLQLGDSTEEAEDRQMENLMMSLRQTEADYEARRSEQEQCRAFLQQHDDGVAAANSAMEEADKAVQDMRKRISEHEAEISNRQREVQSKRTMASSDLSALRSNLSSELDRIKQQQTKLRERALQVQASTLPDGGAQDSSTAQEEMAKLKAEAARLKARAAELEQEQRSVTVDPAQLEQQALEAEAAVQRLCDQREGLRAELQRLEDIHLQARSDWQQTMSGLQQARQTKEVADLQATSLRRQMEGQWASWQPIWSRRLQAWRGRSQALCRARQGSELLSAATALGWEGLRKEFSVRRETMVAVNDLQQSLAELAQGLTSIEDSALEMHED
eukprot:TRINITY_DN20191_c0_g2_i1.p1 TRINITY_DN20191_c0_g2~~TRINITY_DN20191_c0_g2_i1.p1  ORF type:complete len:992 (-),score=286.58 TRINITY_DN20191_c0_g2_i1:77-3052(-)